MCFVVGMATRKVGRDLILVLIDCTGGEERGGIVQFVAFAVIYSIIHHMNHVNHVNHIKFLFTTLFNFEFP